MDHVAYSPFDIPDDLERGLTGLMKTLGLVYGAIDVIRTPDDEFVFLEVNPGGQWLWVEQRTNLLISAAVADLLVTPPNVRESNSLIP